MDSFKDGDYKTVVTTGDVTLYRVFGGNAKSKGAFASIKKATNSIQAKIDNALLSEWKNTRVYEAEIIVPKGTCFKYWKGCSSKNIIRFSFKGWSRPSITSTKLVFRLD